MYIDANTIIKCATVIGAVLSIIAFIKIIVMWISQREKTTAELKHLKSTHNEDICSIKEELCVLSYAMLASLDGLKQLNCNGEVTIAHEKLSKHLNKQAHEQ